MLRSQRWALLLRPALATDLSGGQLHRALDAMRESSVHHTAGIVDIAPWCVEQDDWELLPSQRDRTQVDSFLLDRFTVTNHQFQAFVDQGGYQQELLWRKSIWPRVAEFVDATGALGPRYWNGSRYPERFGDHPVVGVSWFEADAYARWAGKRLPSDAEWVKAACWPLETSGEPLQRKYPWGDVFEPGRANSWGSGRGGTAAVSDFATGDSAGGVRQLVGNVWEWTADHVRLWSRRGELKTTNALNSLRGGAFDTYFDTQADCQLQSGDSPLARRHNIGFRCAVSICDLIQQAADPTERELLAGDAS